MSEWTDGDVRELLEARYDLNEWVRLHELRERPGFQNETKLRTIDFAAMHRWPSKRHRFVCVEIKVSRADFRRETPSKRGIWLDTAHEFWYAAPHGVIPLGELPENCGLLEATRDGLLVAREAKYNRDAAGITRGMLLMAVRDLSTKADLLEYLRRQKGRDE